MGRLYFVRFLRVQSKRHPIVFFLLVAVCISMLYRLLSHFEWFQEVFGFITIMFSSEYGASRLYAEGKSFERIIFSMFAAYAVNITLDYIVVTYALKWQWSKRIIDAFSKRGKAFVRDVKFIIRRFWKNGSDENTTAFGKFKDRLNGYAINPSKAGLWTVFFLALLPRIPFLPGGVGIAVLIIRYNKLGWRGALCLALGICVHASYVLGSIYGVSSLYNQFI